MPTGKAAHKELSLLRDGNPLTSRSPPNGGEAQAAVSLPCWTGRDDGQLRHPTSAGRRCVACIDI